MQTRISIGPIIFSLQLVRTSADVEKEESKARRPKVASKVQTNFSPRFASSRSKLVGIAPVSVVEKREKHFPESFYRWSRCEDTRTHAVAYRDERRRARLLSLVIAMYELKGPHCLNKALAVRDSPRRGRRRTESRNSETSLLYETRVKRSRTARIWDVFYQVSFEVNFVSRARGADRCREREKERKGQGEKM